MNRENKNTKELSSEDLDYLFGSFLDYRNALYLARSLDGLLRLKRALQPKTEIDQKLTDYASSCMRFLFPEIKIPGWTEKEFQDLVESESLNRTLSNDELMEKIEEDAEKLREKIDSGEIDIWDESTKYISYPECQEFMNQCLDVLKAKILPACNPEVSLLESLTKNIVKYLDSYEHDLRTTQSYKALLTLWDTARIFHEGEPPFKLMFSDQVAEQLGIDPILESIKSNTIRPIKKSSWDEKKLNAAHNVCKKSKVIQPDLDKLSKCLLSVIEFE